MRNFDNFVDFKNKFINHFQNKKFNFDVSDNNIKFKSTLNKDLIFDYNIKELYDFLKNAPKYKTNFSDLFETNEKELLENTLLDKNQIKEFILKKNNLIKEKKKLNILFIKKNEKIIFNKKFD